MYASLLISLLAAFIAMLGKQWLNRYLRNSGGSMIERCGDRQHKCNGLEKWPLHSFIESLPMMLQTALLLLACGLCRHMWSINTLVACILITLAGLGVVFYIAIVIAGTSSYACPFQTPASIALRRPWKKARREAHSCIVRSVRSFSRIYRTWNRRFLRLRRQPSPTIVLEDVQTQRPEPWLKPKDLEVLRRTGANDARCVSWILRSITDPEALDAAIRLAGVVRWFDDGIDADPNYDQIVSTLDACFDSTGKLYPGARDRAYYSARAMMWIHTLARCKSEEFANHFPLPTKGHGGPDLDPDLGHLLHVHHMAQYPDLFSLHLLRIDPGHTPSHSQWVSNLLLHLSWARWPSLDNKDVMNFIANKYRTIPQNVAPNRLLMWCIFLGSPIEEEVLRIQDKSYDISLSFSLKVTHVALS